MNSSTECSIYVTGRKGTRENCDDHRRIAFRHVNSNSLGETYAAETGFRISNEPDTVRAPDAAFVSQSRLENCEVDNSTYLPLAPDLVVEVVSPSDIFSEVESKTAAWISAGTQVVLVANPKDKSLRVYRSLEKIEILRNSDIFDAGEACWNWQLSVAEIFA